MLEREELEYARFLVVDFEAWIFSWLKNYLRGLIEFRAAPISCELMISHKRGFARWMLRESDDSLRLLLRALRLLREL